MILFFRTMIKCYQISLDENKYEYNNDKYLDSIISFCMNESLMIFVRIQTYLRMRSKGMFMIQLIWGYETNNNIADKSII